MHVRSQTAQLQMFMFSQTAQRQMLMCSQTAQLQMHVCSQTAQLQMYVCSQSAQFLTSLLYFLLFIPTVNLAKGSDRQVKFPLLNKLVNFEFSLTQILKRQEEYNPIVSQNITKITFIPISNTITVFLPEAS